MKRQLYTHEDQGLSYRGRTLVEKDKTWMNWTCAGVQFQCRGSKVEVELEAEWVMENGNVLSPWFALCLDDNETATKVFELKEGCHWYTLYEGDEDRCHQVRLIKRTEAQHGRSALRRIAIEGEGDLCPLPYEGRYNIEFVGDSITCGYGNGALDPGEGFLPAHEDGLHTYATGVADYFKAALGCVSVSGIGVYSSYTDQDCRNTQYLMKDVYDYADYFVEKASRGKVTTQWDFGKFKPDLIVVNLGTNDRSYLQYDYEERTEAFQEAYKALLRQIREKNGSHPKILCAIGGMAPAIYAIIDEAVQDYKKESHDQDVSTMCFGDQREEEGMGANGHPSLQTHERMAKEMIQKIQDWLQWQEGDR
ncbi:MAG: GDSL-type esterase/lipase family protein [Cellulosilyticaceae bacterium]